MKKVIPGVLCAMVLLGSARPAAAINVYLDGDTLATGSGLGSGPLLTAAGTISFNGEFRSNPADPEFIAAGASGNIFDIDGTQTANFTFDFDVSSISFIYGGNSGDISVRALDIGLNVVDSFFQADTFSGPAGPASLTGIGIRHLVWSDSVGIFAPLDNITISTTAAVADSGSLGAIFSLTLGLLFALRRKLRIDR